ncbi:MAG: hypothetical protein LBK54_00330 [Propionibacteriaceae bacterium]|jgi:phenylpyruvate tautomerase PptA (4-oxalocrotonate tautomerase family)|nr:hypothetical protein [Propionibacteriaceae bacterium]
MPWIHLSTTRALTEQAKAELADEIGHLVEIIAGKFHQKTMIRIDDACQIYRGGELAPCAFMETRIMIPNDWDQQVEYVDQLYDLFERKLDLDRNQVYFNMVEGPSWGSRGSLHRTGG